MDTACGPLTFGQTYLWRDIMNRPRDRWHESNLADAWPIPDTVDYGQARDALATIAIRHPALRTTYDFGDPQAPLQCLHPAGSLPVEILEIPERDVRKFVFTLAAKPISLHKGYGWSAYVITRRQVATHFAVVFHHMTADGMGIRILRDELVSLLRNPNEPSPAESKYDLIQLAIDQRQKPAQKAKQHAAARYWDATLATSSYAPTSGDDVSNSDFPALMVRLRSGRSRAAASKLADQTRTSVGTVLLTAYVRAIAEIQDRRSIPLRVYSSNRYEKRWEQCVTTLAQWTPMHINVDTESFGELAARLHTASMLAYLHGMYDPDVIASIRKRYPASVAEVECVWGVNYFPATASPDHSTAQVEGDGQLTWEIPLRTIGPRFYLRAVDDEEGTWTLQLRTGGVDRPLASALIQRVHSDLISEAARLDPPAAPLNSSR